MGWLMRLNRILSLLLAFFMLLVVDCSLSLFPSSPNPTAPLCLQEDKFALLEFKNTMSIADYGSELCGDSLYSKTSSWNESTNCCSWEGVACDKVTGHVIGLDLSCSSLAGSLPANSSLFRLQRLKRLNLAYNNGIYGSIPPSVSKLVSLTHLNLSRCSFSGLVPYHISLLSKLISIDLSFNPLKFDSPAFAMLTHNLSGLSNLFLYEVNMSDVVPTSFVNMSSSLKRLCFGACELQGEFPVEFFHLPYLEYLDLSSNYDLIGYLPMSNMSSTLESLDLSYSGFRGSIPDVFGKLDKLIYLDFENCNFSGQLPSSLFSLIHLSHLDLSNNSVEGFLPNQVSGLQNLKEIHLEDNLLSGAIPSWLFSLSSLKYLDLSRNNFTGPIDQIQKPNFIQRVYCDNNHIQGEIPDSLFDLVHLTELQLSSNKLGGLIKLDLLSKLKNLEILDLSSNNFSGAIKPDLLSKLKNLQMLYLSNNTLLSLSGASGANYTFEKLEYLFFSSCNIRQFPSFLRTGKRLSYLDLSNNKINGSIFKWESEGWESLYTLNLSHNFLTGLEQFPAGKELYTLDLRSNRLQGTLPTPPPSLGEFYISNNNLTGNIPPTICNLTSLKYLDLSRNHFGGTIPECLGNISSFITTINLQRNNFHGKIPDSFGHNDLISLALNDNQLEGILPPSLINCTSLSILNLGGNELSETFPYWLGMLPNLQVLFLRSNRFYGPLDSSKVMPHSFPSLKIIDLSQNEFSGLLPTKFFQSLDAMKEVSTSRLCPENYRACYTTDSSSVRITMKMIELEMELDLGKISPGFTLVDFSSNQFYGRIPVKLGELHGLLVLNLSHNHLNGCVPPSFGSMAALESLDLSSNKPGCRIPSQLTNLTFLEVLNLSQNNLEGPIPHGKQFDTFNNDSYSGNLGLCGLPLSKRCGNDSPPAPTIKDHDGSTVAFIWKLAMMGYGCGLVLGLSTGYIVFTTGKPWWFVKMVERDLQVRVTRWFCRKRGRRN